MHGNLEALLTFLVPLLEKHSIKKIAEGNNNAHDSIDKPEVAIKKESEDEIFNTKGSKITRDKMDDLKNPGYHDYTTGEHIAYYGKDSDSKTGTQHIASADNGAKKGLERISGSSNNDPLPIINTLNRRDDTRLPEIFVIKILNRHDCYCLECVPRFEREIESRMIRKVYRDNIALLTVDIKNRIIKKVIATHKKDIEEKVVIRLNTSISKKVEKRRAIYEIELRAKIFEEITKKWEDKLTVNYRVKVEAEVRSELRRKMNL